MLIPAVVYIVLYASAYWVLGVSTILTLLAFLEYNNLTLCSRRDGVFDWAGCAAAASIPPLVYFCGIPAFPPAFLGLVFLLFLYGLFSGRELRDSSADLSHKALGLAYIALPISYLALLRDLPSGQWWILFLLVIVWVNDTAALLTGKTIGRRKLAPEISPKKTIEGAAGGILGGGAAAIVLNRAAGMGLADINAFTLAVIIGIVAMAGDLAESLLKRAAGVKDSGTLIPGHGGVLDRIDSLIFPVPLLYYYITMCKGI